MCSARNPLWFFSTTTVKAIAEQLWFSEYPRCRTLTGKSDWWSVAVSPLMGRYSLFFYTKSSMGWDITFRYLIHQAECFLCNSKYLAALRNVSGFFPKAVAVLWPSCSSLAVSLNFSGESWYCPKLELQALHKIPLVSPEIWQWSKWVESDSQPPILRGFLQIAQQPPWFLYLLYNSIGPQMWFPPLRPRLLYIFTTDSVVVRWLDLQTHPLVPQTCKYICVRWGSLTW